MKTNKEINWQEKLIDLIEEEIYLATGDKSKKHFSGKCKMNEILGYVEDLLEAQKAELVKGFYLLLED